MLYYYFRLYQFFIYIYFSTFEKSGAKHTFHFSTFEKSGAKHTFHFFQKWSKTHFPLFPKVEQNLGSPSLIFHLPSNFLLSLKET